MKKILIAITAFLFGSYYSMAQWNYLGLKNIKVNALEVKQNFIYAATDKGIYKKSVWTTDTIWNLVGFYNLQVNDIYIRDTTIIYAGVQITTIGSDTISLFTTNNGGVTWNPLWGTYDADQFSYVQLTNIDGLTEDSDTIIIMSGGIRKSVDGGTTFTKVNNIGGRFITIAPGNSDIIWTGSEGVFLNPYLLQSTNKGDNWYNNDSLQQIVNGDNACLSAAIHPINSSMIYVGMEGQLAKSTDNGLNWSLVLENNYYLKSVKISPNNANTVYCTGGTFGGQNITLFVSNDNGNSWDTLFHFLGDEVDALELAVVDQSGNDLVCIGTRSNGVFIYQNNPNSVTEIDNAFFKVYPNPASTYTTIEFNSFNYIPFSYKIYNSSGQIVDYKSDIPYNKIEVPTIDIAPGLYFFEVFNKEGYRAFEKVLFE